MMMIVECRDVPGLPVVVPDAAIPCRTSARAWHAPLAAHALEVCPNHIVEAVGRVLRDAAGAVPFCVLVDAVGGTAAARFGLLGLAGLGRARILTPGPLVSGSVVVEERLATDGRTGGGDVPIGAGVLPAVAPMQASTPGPPPERPMVGCMDWRAAPAGDRL